MRSIQNSSDGLHFLAERLPESEGDRAKIDNAIERRRSMLRRNFAARYSERYLVALLLYTGYHSDPLPASTIGNIYGVQRRQANEMIRKGLRMLMWEGLWKEPA